MKITHISDTHGDHEKLIINNTDFLIITGDYSHKNTEKEFTDFIDWFKQQPARYKLLINGNHDHFYYRQPDNFNKIIGSDIIHLENSGIQLEGIRFWGSPVTVPILAGIYSPSEIAETNREIFCETIPENTNVLITHSPPLGILDRLKEDTHLGCRFLARRIRNIRPKYHLFGHIHQSYGRIIEDGTEYINAALVVDSEKIIRNPMIFEY